MISGCAHYITEEDLVLWNTFKSQRKLATVRRWIKVGCLVVGLSLLAGGLVYVLVMVMYRVADALSLSPGLKNLAPLPAIAVFWLIASRVGKYFQRRAERKTPQLTQDQEEQRRQAWLNIKAKGKRRYIWRTGVIGWGLSVFAIFTPTTLIFGPRTHQLSITEIVAETMLSFFVWMVAGYFFGLWMWKTFDKKYS